MSGWTKLFGSIVTSSVWIEPHPVLRVWVAMLAMADANGIVEGSIPGFANLCRVTIPEMEEAIKKFSSPDSYSRSPEADGRRIEAVPGGWRIINRNKYRDKGQDAPGSRAADMRRYRQRKKEYINNDVTDCNALPPLPTRYTEIEKEKNSPNSKPYKLSCYFLQLILDRKPDLKKPNLQTWAKSFDRMIRLDNRNPDRIAEVLEWSQKDNFWKKNILSPDTLRKQFDRIEIQMEGK